MRQTGNVEPAVQVESAQRVMRIELSRELDRLDEHLAFLATVGSTSLMWGYLVRYGEL